MRPEAAALAVDQRITNSEGATVARSESEFVYANSLGFPGGYRSSRHHIDCSVIGERGRRDAARLLVLARRARRPISRRQRHVGRIAGERTLRRLGGRKLGTLECPVLFEAPEAADLIGYFVQAVSGGSLYRKSSFLLDSSGSRCSRRTSSSREEPHLLRGRGSAPFDERRGCDRAARRRARRRRARAISSARYSARKLGMQTTGNGGGSHNLVLAHGDDDLPALLARMGRGLLVTEQLGQGVNPVTGDFSRGAAGFWVENGDIAYPVEEITIAGNLRDMFRDIVAVGNDVDRRGSRHTGRSSSHA